MGLLSRLIGEEAAKKAVDALQDIAGKAADELSNLDKALSERAASGSADAPRANTVNANSGRQAETYAPYGVSWGDKKPSEPNQFNYQGTYQEYFQNLFSKEFPQYRIDCREVNKGLSTLYTFYDGDREALAVEVTTQRTESQAVRKRSRAAGVPYLRYYYDHPGWWNTYSYVTARTRAALSA